MKSQILILGSMLGSALSAQAYPQVSPKCAQQVQINSVDNGAGVYLSDDCKTGYVLPPAKGTVVLSGLSPTFSLRQCAPFESALNMVEQSYAQADQLLKDYWKPATKKGSSSNSPLGPNLGLGGGGPLGSGGRQGAGGNPQDSEDSRRANIMTQYRKAMEVAEEAQGFLEPFKAIEGATGQMTFTANWDKLVSAYQQANPQIRFERLPLSNQALSYTRKLSTDAVNMPAAFKIQIPGVAAINLDGRGNGGDSNVVFGEAISGQVVLSLAGSCPFYNNVTKTLKSRVAGTELSSHFSANVQFEFNLQAKRNYHASYNLAQLMKRIQESGSNGGFFSSSSYSKLLIERKSDDWFQFSSEDEDPRFAYDLDSLRASVKADLINRVTRSIVEMNGGDATSVPPPGAPGPHGATLASAALKKCPNMYCQLGAVALDILDATFGSSSTNSTYINQNNYWAKEDVNEVKTLPFTGSYTFIGGQ